jgi:putative MATE family efflux protein
MNNGAPTELGTEKVGTLLKRYATPGIIAMTASSLYNMVDSIYIGNIPEVGTLAMSGLAVTFPLMNLSAAIGTLVGVGAATMTSMLLGQKNYEVANKVLANTMTLNTIFGILFSVLVLSFLDPILYFFGASDATIPYARDYMTYILIGNVVTHLYMGLNNIIRASGNPKTAMGLTLFTVISNAIMDPIFIFTFKMGIKGAAIATVLCQLIALVIAIIFLRDSSRIIHFRRGAFGWDKKIAKASLTIGMGPFLMNFASCIISMLINQQLKAHGGDIAIAAYGVANRITFFFLMICMGFNQGMQPIASYNWGAKLYSRVRKVYWLTTGCVAVMTILCFIFSVICPQVLVSIFTSDPVLKEHSIYGLRIMNMAVGVISINLVAANFYQNIGMVKKSIFLSLSRQIIILVPLLYILPIFMGENGVWYSFPISDVASVIIAFICISITFRKLDKLKDGEGATAFEGKI